MESEQNDIRQTPAFQDFKSEVLSFVLQNRRVTWGQIARHFEGCHYWIALAVEELDGGEVVWDRGKFPEVIRIKEEKIMPKLKVTEVLIEKCAAEGASKQDAARILGINPTYFYSLLKQKPEMNAAWEKGQTKRAASLLRAEKKHIEAAIIQPKIEFAEVVPSQMKIEIVEPKNGNGHSNGLSSEIKDLLKKIRAEFIYQDAFGAASPQRESLIENLAKVI
jgi:hypothetical protein